MSEPLTCQNCKHWFSVHAGNHMGKCTRIKMGPMNMDPASVIALGEWVSDCEPRRPATGYLFTRLGFYCNLHEPGTPDLCIRGVTPMTSFGEREGRIAP